MTVGEPSSAGRAAPRIDAARLRRARSRHAVAAARHGRLPGAVAEHLMEHLEPIRLDPARVLQVGAGPDALWTQLRRRYPSARLVLVDDSARTLRHAAAPPRWPRLRPSRMGRVCCSPSALPLAGASVDLLCSNLALGLMDDAGAAFAEYRRVLRHGALLMFSFLGPDSFHELRGAWRAVDDHVHLHPFVDLHEVGDALVHAGFSDVVVDVERLHAEFDDVDHVLRELRESGGGHAAPERRRGLMSPRALDRLRAAYPRDSSGAPVRATLEVGYAHAWALDPPGVEVTLPAR